MGHQSLGRYYLLENLGDNEMRFICAWCLGTRGIDFPRANSTTCRRAKNGRRCGLIDDKISDYNSQV